MSATYADAPRLAPAEPDEPLYLHRRCGYRGPLEVYDDGDDYPPNVRCPGCGGWDDDFAELEFVGYAEPAP